MSLKEIYDKWNSINLVLRIVCGLAIGIILALIIPNVSGIELLGDFFIGALKAIAPFLVFILVVCSLAKSNSKHGNQFKLVIALYLFSTIVAATLATAVSFIFPVTVTLDIPPDPVVPETTDLGQLISNLIMKLVDNPLNALINGNYLGILFWAVMGGLILRAFCSNNTICVVNDLADVVSSIVKFIISFAPFGILGIVYRAISENGMEIFTEYGQLLLILVGCMLAVALITNPAIVGFLLKKNPYPLAFRCYKDSGLTAFFTRSSAANIPMNIKLCEKMNVDKEFYSVSIPLGATINMNGAAITITVMTLAAVSTLHMDVPFGLAALLAIVSTIAACGASGIAGGSLLLIPMACSLFGVADNIAMQMVAIGFIIGVIQDSFETALNSSSDAFYTIAADRYAKKKAGIDIDNIPEKEVE